MFAYVFAAFLNTLPILFPTILINLHQPTIIKAFKDELEFKDESRDSEKQEARAAVVVTSTRFEATIEEESEDDSDDEEEDEQYEDAVEEPIVPHWVLAQRALSDSIRRDARKRAIELVEWAALPFGTEEEPAPRSCIRPSLLSLGWSSPLRESWVPEEEQDQELPTVTLVVPKKAPMWVCSSDWTVEDDEDEELEPIAAVEEFWAAKAK